MINAKIENNSLNHISFRIFCISQGEKLTFSSISMDILFETNGAVTVLPPGRTAYSHLLVNNGEIVE